MALRVAILAAIALAVFAVLLLRLWSLQVLSGSKYEAAARNNQLRTFPIEAQRGPILDRKGRTLVTNAASTAVDIVPIDLPKQGRYAEMKRLSMVLNVPLPKLLARLEQGMKNPLTPVTMQVAVHPDQVAYLAERNREFPGVQITPTYLRKYNTEALLAHVLGYVGEISPGSSPLQEALQDLPDHPGEGGERSLPGRQDRPGRSGAERTTSTSAAAPARSSSGSTRSAARSATPVVTRAPTAGYPIRLTIDISLQRAAERALQYGIRLAHQDGHWLAERRRDRGDEPVERRDPGDGLRRRPTSRASSSAGRTEEARAAARPEDGEGGQLPRPEPRDRGPVSARARPSSP